MGLEAPVALDHGLEAASDAELVKRCVAGEEEAVRVLTQRFNQRLFRVARSIVRDDDEAEDVVQEAYVKAFTHLGGFRGEAEVATWLTRIAINEALARVRKRRPSVDIDTVPVAHPHARSNPEAVMEQHHLRDLLEQSIDELPRPLRVVFMARIVEGLSVEETAHLFQLRPETVKTRLHRSRRRLQAALDARVGGAVREAFSFDGERCRRTTARVLARLRNADVRREPSDRSAL